MNYIMGSPLSKAPALGSWNYNFLNGYNHYNFLESKTNHN